MATAVGGGRRESWPQPATGVQCLGYASALEKHSGLLASASQFRQKGRMSSKAGCSGDPTRPVFSKGSETSDLSPNLHFFF